VLLGFVVALVVGLTLMHRSSSVDYHDVGALQQAIQEKANTRLAQDGVSVRIDGVSCASVGGANDQYLCTLHLSTGSSTHAQITVAPDGTGYTQVNLG
jgi:hypothetical protein